jgi:hypothetical protein
VLDSEFATILVAMETQESVARALQPDIDLVAKLVCVREFESTSIHPNHVDARL